MQWAHNHYVIEMTDESDYSFASADNARNYIHEYLLEPKYRPSSKHGVVCIYDGNTRGPVMLGASGGQTAVHGRSCVLLDNCCIVAVGDRIAALRVPDLALQWSIQADDATCFGLHLTADEKHVIVHGELEISKVTLTGQKEWQFSGRDIFTGKFVLDQDAVLVTDFNGNKYAIDLAQGHGRIIEYSSP